MLLTTMCYQQSTCPFLYHPQLSCHLLIYVQHVKYITNMSAILSSRQLCYHHVSYVIIMSAVLSSCQLCYHHVSFVISQGIQTKIQFYFIIIDAHKAVYNVDNLGEALIKLMETTIRQEVGRQNSDDLIVSRQQIGANVQRELEKATDLWGVKITRIEIQEIKFDESLQDNLVKQREAELVKRGQVVEAQQDKEVMITKAEGIRQEQILLAEGKKQAQILEAEGKFEAARLESEGNFLLESRAREGEAKGMTAMGEALRENPEGLIILDALEAQTKVAKSIGESNNTLIIPSETAGLFGVIGSITKTLGMMENGFNFSKSKNTEETKNIKKDKS